MLSAVKFFSWMVFDAVLCTLLLPLLLAVIWAMHFYAATRDSWTLTSATIEGVATGKGVIKTIERRGISHTFILTRFVRAVKLARAMQRDEQDKN